MTTKTLSNFDLEYFFGTSIEDVDSILENKDNMVKLVKIPKRTGGLRTILMPAPRLKYIQKSIYWKLLNMYKPHKAAHGFCRDRSIVTNAEPHVGARSLGKIDIKDFFDSITTNHLQNCLFGNSTVCKQCKFYERKLDGLCNPSLYHNKKTKFRHTCEEIKAVFIPEYCDVTGYQSLFRRAIDACTINGHTVQGFPTSPALANIVLKGLDKNLDKYCKDIGIVYTRYADDLAFSSETMNKTELMMAVTKHAYSQLWAYNFTPNKKKTKFKSRTGRLRVCGVVVNEKLSVQRNSVKKFRAAVHHATVKHPENTTKALLRSLKGWASHLMSVDKDKGVKYYNILKDFEAAKFPKVAA